MSEVIETVDTADNTAVDSSQDTPNAEVSKEGSSQTEAAPQEHSEDEQRAMEHGWRPKEEFVGDTKKWVSAEEFLRRGELFDKIDVMGRDLRDTKKALKMLQAHHEQLRELDYKKAMQSLKDEKKQAYEEGNHDKLVEIDDQLLSLREAEKAEKQAVQQQAAQPDPRFVQWVGQNAWYTQDQELRTFGDEVGVSYARTYPEKSPDEVLKYVESRVRKAFPEKFVNPNRSKPNAVTSGTAQKGISQRENDYPLTDDERRAMQTFIRQGILTKEEYIADIKRIKGA